MVALTDESRVWKMNQYQGKKIDRLSRILQDVTKIANIK